MASPNKQTKKEKKGKAVQHEHQRLLCSVLKAVKNIGKLRGKSQTRKGSEEGLSSAVEVYATQKKEFRCPSEQQREGERCALREN